MPRSSSKRSSSFASVGRSVANVVAGLPRSEFFTGGSIMRVTAGLDSGPVAMCEAVEIGTGNYPGDAHCKPDELLADEGKARAFRRAVEDRGLMISGGAMRNTPPMPRSAVMFIERPSSKHRRVIAAPSSGAGFFDSLSLTTSSPTNSPRPRTSPTQS